MDDSTAGRYDMIIVKKLFTKLGIDLKFSTNTIECGEELYKECKTLMENLNDYDFEPINRKMRSFSQEPFLNTYVYDSHESEPVRTATNRVRTILEINYEKADLNKTINVHCQHLTASEQEQM